ncbi:hypothetical protein HCR_17760 [Hydrogenimonas cancrithermarum]|uniref:Uncharacterized protein n=2 Tax=Hydrogenimonas cancrithermarum TaxID=2993563 RepID=A0ABM8FM94_9BACT|nr:hypothetical protein HCR_17760 [Hydrogenimonas cancrithermarum]
MQNSENVQNAMSTLYHVGLVGSELVYEGKEVSSEDTTTDKSALQKLADRFNVLRSDGLAAVESMSPSGMDLNGESHEVNCSVSGTRTVTYDENESEQYELATYQFNNCKEYEGFLEDLVEQIVAFYGLDSVENGDGYEPTTDTYTFNGEILLKKYWGEDANSTWDGYRIDADELTVKMENNETLDKGTLDATIYAQFEERKMERTASEPILQLEDATESTTLSLLSDGCLSLVAYADDGNNSTIKVADANLQAVDFNATAVKYTVADTVGTTVSLDGYIGTSGYVALAAGIAVDPAQQIDLGGFALYGENFEFNIEKTGLEENVTVSGTLATPCMGGAVTYSGQMNVYAKYDSQDGNDSALPYTGSVLLQGATNAAVDFNLDENNQTYATTSVDTNKTYGSWEALIEGNCTALFEGVSGSSLPVGP